MTLRSRCRSASALLAIAVVFGATLGATSAHNACAEERPSLWDAARDPTTETQLGARERYLLHIQAMSEVQFNDRDSGEKIGSLRAKAMLERAHVKDSPDPRLRIDLGVVYEDLEDYSAAIAVLTSALAMSPSPSREDAVRAWYRLSLAYAHMDRPDQEVLANERFIALEDDDYSRATALYNRADAEMRRGNLRDAITGYRDAINLAGEIRASHAVDTYILAIWGLAVALDRNGDATGALIEAKRAVSHDPGMRLLSPNHPSVFFVPPHDRFFYIGMGELARADDARSTREKRDHYHGAFAAFSAYEMAAFSDDRWLRRAQEHRAFAMKKLHELGPAPREEPEHEDAIRSAPWLPPHP
jgi:tetratricopeptide (TPR) repeat protein